MGNQYTKSNEEILICAPGIKAADFKLNLLNCLENNINVIVAQSDMIKKQDEKIKELEDKIIELKYQPDGKGFHEAKEHFKSLVD